MSNVGDAPTGFPNMGCQENMLFMFDWTILFHLSELNKLYLNLHNLSQNQPNKMFKKNWEVEISS